MTESQTLSTNDVYRLVLKNIPDKISNDCIIDILKKNFENNIFDISVNKLKHKYNNLKNKKVCLLSTNGLNIRRKIIDFFLNYEFVDPKGLKHKFTVVDSLHQPALIKTNDKIENTIYTMDHFSKFKEFFEQGKVYDFKNEEHNFSNGLFDNVEELPAKNEARSKIITRNPESDKSAVNKKGAVDQNKNLNASDQKKKIIIIKKNPNDVSEVIVTNNQNEKSTNNINNYNKLDVQTEIVVVDKSGYNNKKSKGGDKYYDKNNEYYEEDTNYENGQNHKYSNNKKGKGGEKYYDKNNEYYQEETNYDYENGQNHKYSNNKKSKGGDKYYDKNNEYYEETTYENGNYGYSNNKKGKIADKYHDKNTEFNANNKNNKNYEYEYDYSSGKQGANYKEKKNANYYNNKDYNQDGYYENSYQDAKYPNTSFGGGKSYKNNYNYKKGYK